MDFSGGGAPRFFQVPWQPSFPGFQHDANLNSIYADSTGKLQLYFLNGTYYDGQHNVVWRDSNFIYTLAGNCRCTAGIIKQEFSWFFPINNGDTTNILHFYFSFPKRNANLVTMAYSPQILKVNRLKQINGSWQITHLDSKPDSLGRYITNQVGKASAYWNPYTHSPWMAMNGAVGNYGGAFYRSQIAYLDNNQEIDTTDFGYNAYFLLDMAERSIQHPLTGSIFLGRGNYQQNATIKSHLKEYFLLPNWQLLPVGQSRALPVPSIQGTGLSYNWYPGLLEISPQGRYLYAYMAKAASNNTPSRLMRYDLFAPDSISFVNRAAEIPLPPSIGSSKHLNELQAAPDGNMYFITYSNNTSLANLNDYNHWELGRITHPDTSNPSAIQVNANYHTFPPWTLHSSLPDRLPNQLPMKGFQQLTYCSGNVKLRFNYPAVTDSVWWSFGDTTLGAANHDTATHPVIPYNEPGKYYVSVELWWQGRKWRTLGHTVVVKPQPELDLPGDTILCPGDTLRLDARQGMPAQYQWNTGSTDSTLTVRDSGYYRLEVSTSCGTVSDSLWVHYHALPEARPLRDTNLCQNDSVLLSVAQPGPVSYRWENGDTSPSRWIDSTGTYQVRIGTICDTIIAGARVAVEPCGCRFFVPDAFSPNGDGMNDRFAIKYHCDSVTFQLQILNRWGQVIYRQTEADPFWDGRYQNQPAPEGVYLYRLVFKGGSGEHFREEERHGRLVLIR
jgi:gliding motility-associated-like protein